ncbi:hypothetical protein GQ42DRAFT_145636 [Ramicandelaber brevisporus]|nr:hypothetical protein GQ42DRAFT_145636 [Ramicandelaber brevisporus]
MTDSSATRTAAAAAATAAIRQISVPEYAVVSLPSKHVAYRIEVRESVRSWSVWRRYSEFDTLNAALTHSQLSSLIGFSSSFDPTFLEERRLGLERYLSALFASPDSRWRAAPEWIKFLNIKHASVQAQSEKPAAASEANANSSNSQLVYSPESWMTDIHEVKQMADAVRSALRQRDTAAARGETTLSHQSRVQARKMLTVLGKRMADLDNGLNSLGVKSPYCPTPLSNAEINRRRAMLTALVEERAVLTRLAVATTTAGTASEASRQTPNMIPRTTRAFGLNPVQQQLLQKHYEETEVTRKLDDKQMLQLQKQMFDNQDKSVERLRDVILRQKDIATTIGQELDIQNQLLREMEDDVDRLGAKMNTTTKQIDNFSKS